jgi:hypothetical protein
MRRFAMLALALTLGAFGAAACDDDNPNGPSNSGPIVFTAALSASNEVPAISNAESQGTGTVTITFVVPRDSSGNVSGDGTWNVQAVVSGLTPDTEVRLAHIHTGAAGINGPVFVNTGLSAATAIRVPSSATINLQNIFISQAQATAVVANPAGHYFNMHSALNGGGVVRGQLVRVQ